MELESNVEKGTTRQATQEMGGSEGWPHLEFRADTEQEAIEYRDRWMRNEEAEEGGEG